jgi:hypothetical protein
MPANGGNIAESWIEVHEILFLLAAIRVANGGREIMDEVSDVSYCSYT